MKTNIGNTVKRIYNSSEDIIKDIYNSDGLAVFNYSDGISFQSITNTFGLVPISDAVYGNGLYVICGGSGSMAYSSDLKIWYNNNIDSIYTITNMTFINNIFIALVGSDIIMSEDGINWTTVYSGVDQDLEMYSITYGSGRYIVVGAEHDEVSDVYLGVLITSTNGSIWTKVPNYSSNPSYCVFGNNKFVSLGYSLDYSNFVIQTSTNGIDWTEYSSAVFDSSDWVKDMSFGGGIFMALSNGGTNNVCTSTDGITWELNSLDVNSSTVRFVDYEYSKFWVTLSDGLFSSSDGNVWTEDTQGTEIDATFIRYMNSELLAFGYCGNTFKNVENIWERYGTNFLGANLYTMLFDGSYYRMISADSGSSSLLFTSSNGYDWTTAHSNVFVPVSSLAYGNGKYVAVGASGKMSVSSDFSTWTVKTSGFGTTAITKVIYANSLFVAVGKSGKLFTSLDGDTWTQRTSQFSTKDIYDIVYENSKFVIVGASGAMSYSTDGTTWIALTPGLGTYTFIKVLWDGSKYIVASTGAANNKLWGSEDLATWDLINTFESGFSTMDLDYGKDLYIALSNLGTSNILKVSLDLTDWKVIPDNFGEYAAKQVAYLNGMLFLVGSGGIVTVFKF